MQPLNNSSMQIAPVCWISLHNHITSLSKVLSNCLFLLILPCLASCHPRPPLHHYSLPWLPSCQPLAFVPSSGQSRMPGAISVTTSCPNLHLSLKTHFCRVVNPVDLYTGFLFVAPLPAVTVSLCPLTMSNSGQGPFLLEHTENTQPIGGTTTI